MTSAVRDTGPVPDRVATLLAAATALVDAPAGDFDRLSDEAVIGVLRQVEVVRRRLDAVDVALTGQVQARDLAGRASVSSTRRFLVGLLRISPGEAARRVRHAALLGPRVQVTGAVLAPALPAAAAALATGQLSSAHVHVIAQARDRLPAAIITGAGVTGAGVTGAGVTGAGGTGAGVTGAGGTVPCDWDSAEQLLTDAAASFDPQSLTVLARRVTDHLDPDGQLTTSTDRARRRSLSITPLPEGMYRLHGHLDTTTGMLTRALLDSLAAPTTTHTDHSSDSSVSGATDSPGRAGQAAGQARGQVSGMQARAAADPRTPAQRRHDALHTLLSRAAAAGDLPATGGIPAALTITMTLDQYLTQHGLARDAYGQPLTIPDALHTLDEADITWLIHQPHTTPDTNPPATSTHRTPPPGDIRRSTTPPGTPPTVTPPTEDARPPRDTSPPRHSTDDGTDGGTAPDPGTRPWIEPRLFHTTPTGTTPTGTTPIGTILHLGRSRRIATHTQTLALHARDQGCTFPGCDTPPTWTQRHHITPWRDGGTTDLTNLTLLCGPHHRHIDTGGWTITMHPNGHPYYNPPPWIDPHQQPIRNLRL